MSPWRRTSSRNSRPGPSCNIGAANSKGGSTMYRILLTVAVAVGLSAAALGQSKGRVSEPGKSQKVLIEMTRAYVDTEIGKDILVMTDRETHTPSGLMGVAEVKGRWDSVELEAPVVR